MSAITAVVRRLTGLLHAEWDVTLGPGSDPARRSRGGSGVRLAGEARQGLIMGGAPVEEATRCRYDRAVLRGSTLTGTCTLSTFRGAQLVEPSAQAGARVTACDLEGARIEGGDLGELDLVACSLREVEVQDTPLGRLELCDLYGARLEGVRVQHLVGCDLRAARLLRCDLRGADLRGSHFVRAELRDCRLEGARVEGAVFASASGLDADTRRRLLRGGATFHGAALTGWLRRLAPQLDPLALDKAGAAVTWGGALLGAALSAAGVWVVVHPPPAPEVAELPPPLARTATAEERRRTQENLRLLRESLAAAHDRMVEGGAVNRTWPTITELQDNSYDTDGDAAGELHDRIVPSGFLDNFLTDSQGGVLPYCNEDPTQETLSGVDTDWHYCELTGRVFAGAGYSEEATLNW